MSYDDLEPHYERHEAMLQGAPYPMDHAPYATTPKTVALREAADTLGLEWILPKLAITFSPDGTTPALGEPVVGEEPNLHGRTRQTCRLCGECNFGCNYGSKYTLDFNYLSFAKLRHGADIRTRCEVKTFAPRPEGGYVIRYVDHSEAVEGEKRQAPLSEHTLTAIDSFSPPAPSARRSSCSRTARASRGSASGSGRASAGTATCSRSRRDPRDRERRPAWSRDRAWLRPGDHEHDPRARPARGRPGRAFYVQDGGYPDTINWMMEVGDQPAALFRACAS